MLIGGGDPTLSAGRYPSSFYPRPAALVTLAAQTARALHAKGISSVRLTYDNSLFVGPVQAEGWPERRRELYRDRQRRPGHRA